MAPETPIVGLTPRDRLQRAGPNALSTSELLGLVLHLGAAGEQGIGLAEQMLAEQGGLLGLAKLSLERLETEVHGLGPAKAAQLQAVFELGKRMTVEIMGERPKINSPADAASLLMFDMAPLEEEHLRVIMLNNRNHVLGVHEVYKGALYTALIRAGDVFREPVRRSCAAIILAHNHPSGDPSPSPEDVSVTRALTEAGKLLDISVLDHLIIGHGRFVSLQERGLVALPSLHDSNAPGSL